ncbi:uncharacterized protein LOC123673452 [Harmonia axyridis]|uniref:uncharacterized protein LOC123673452 n=1 Tax=Harmonia axyridis TaxID=115357 RepID=UPI001E277844|nr:uncharacterized protein LOC123673452 [Harmonia axyridis]
MATILQTNLGRCKAAHDMAQAAAMSEKIDILVVSEPNKKITAKEGWFVNDARDIAVKITNRKLVLEKVKREKNFIHLVLPGYHVYAIYVSPNVSLENFKEKIDSVFGDASIQKGGKIIVGDINSKSPMWGAPSADRRGEYVEEWLSQLAWTAMNNGKPTFVRGSSKTHIDVTLVPNTFAKKITDWNIKHENPYTLHGHIYFRVNTKMPTNRGDTGRVSIFDKERFIKDLTDNINASSTGSGTDMYKKALQALQRSKRTEKEKQTTHPYWWSRDVEVARGNYLRARRNYTRMGRRNHGNRNSECEEMRKLGKELKKDN